MQHKEGEIWTEKGKTWTIKNGVKQTVSRFAHVRSMLYEPLSCPECGKKMNHRNDTIMWKHHKKCFDCVITYETELIRTGQFEEYQKNKVTANMKTFINDLTQYADEYAATMSNRAYVTEDGDVEDWVGGLTKEKVDEIINPQVEKLKKSLEDATSDKNNN